MRGLLDTKHRFVHIGSSSHELGRLKHSVDRLMEVMRHFENKDHVEDRYLKLRRELIRNIEKEAQKYIELKQGTKHKGDNNWQPFSEMGRARYRAAKELLNFAKNYPEPDYEYGKAPADSITDKVVDLLDKDQWLSRLGDIDPKAKKPEDVDEQNRQIDEIQDCVVGLLNAHFSRKFIEKEELSEDAAEFLFEDNSEKLKNGKIFKKMLEAIPAKDPWEKAMSLKKAIEADGGAKILKRYEEVVLNKKKSKKQEEPEPEIIEKKPTLRYRKRKRQRKRQQRRQTRKKKKAKGENRKMNK